MAKTHIGLPQLNPSPNDVVDQASAYANIRTLFGEPIAHVHPNLSLASGPADADFLSSMAMNVMYGPLDTNAEKTLLKINQNTFDDFPAVVENPNLDLFYAHAATIRAGWEPPRNKTKPILIYTPHDVIEGADELLHTGSVDKLIASITYCFEPKTLGFVFESEVQYTDMLNALRLYNASHVNDPAVWKMFNELDTVTLDDNTLTQSLLLRKNEQDTLDGNSFGATLLAFLMEYASASNNTTAIAPFSFKELVAPRSVVFINATAHATSTPNEINQEWMKLIKSIDHPLNMVNLNKITKLTAAITNQQKIQEAAATATNMKKNVSKQGKATFRQSEPTTADISKAVEKIMRAMGHAAHSNNVTTTIKRSPLRQSRRQPNNPNALGRIHRQSFYNDLHIYLDCSGSISVTEQKDGLLAIVKLAKKFNCDLYFSSFSDVLSQEVLIPVKGRSTAQIWKYILSIPKVGGGTDFKQISDYIMASPERQNRLNIAITDFGWQHRGSTFAHPKNLYYAPCSTNNWTYVKKYCNWFIDSMHIVEPRGLTISRCLGMFQ